MISGFLAVGNGENCPFCKEQGKKYIVNKDTDIVKHMMDEHKNDFESKLFGGGTVG
jgi:hypothetical protein